MLLISSKIMMGKTMIKKIISGGQTGVDRAALDAGLTMGIDIGGWCPKDRRAEDGCINLNYSLQETPHQDYKERTEWNIRDSDGTLILSQLPLSGGTALTKRIALNMDRPILVIDITKTTRTGFVKDWLIKYQIHHLNIAGPRESNYPGIYQQAKQWMCQHEQIWKSS